MKYSLEGVNGNAYVIMGYTATALRETGHQDKIQCMYDRAMAGDYDNLLWVCQKYLDIANDTEEE